MREAYRLGRTELKIRILAWVVVLLTAFSALVSISLAQQFKTIPNQTTKTVTIQVPVLQNPVTIDGRIAPSDEWSDTNETSLTLRCVVVNCAEAPVDNVEALVWMKHDYTWLYVLLRVTYPRFFGCPLKCPLFTIGYCEAPPPILTVPCDMGLLGLLDNDQSFLEDRWCTRPPFGGCTADINSPGGERNVGGKVIHDGAFWWFEFKKMLDSGDGYDWAFKPGNTYGVPGVNGTITLTFGSGDTIPGWGQRLTLSFCPCGTQPVTTGLTTSTAQAKSSATSETKQDVQSIPSQPAFWVLLFSQIPAGTLGLVGVFATAIVASTLALIHRRRSLVSAIALKTIATQYDDLDRSLAGGIPLGHSVLVLSPPCDERDLLLRRIIGSALSSGMKAFYVSDNLGRAQELVRSFPNDFYAFSPEAAKVSSRQENLVEVPGIGNLVEFTILLNRALTEHSKEERKKMIVVDVLSDILLRYKAMTTRRWLSEFITKRKAAGFTVLATTNPKITSKEETERIIDLFDGIIEIFEKELRARLRRFLVIKKMLGRKYSQTEILLDIDRLF